MPLGTCIYYVTAQSICIYLAYNYYCFKRVLRICTLLESIFFVEYITCIHKCVEIFLAFLLLPYLVSVEEVCLVFFEMIVLLRLRTWRGLGLRRIVQNGTSIDSAVCPSGSRLGRGLGPCRIAQSGTGVSTSPFLL